MHTKFWHYVMTPNYEVWPKDDFDVLLGIITNVIEHKEHPRAAYRKFKSALLRAFSRQHPHELNTSDLSVMSQSLIFITGATGFIGAHVVAQTLEAGHHVRLSVRKESQISSLKELFAGHEAKLNFAVIPDLTKPGAFDQALQGAEYVFHLASPMPGKGSDFKTDYLGPAVEGTNALLDAAKAIPSIKRVVVMASVLSLATLDALAGGEFTAKGKKKIPTPCCYLSVISS